MNLAALRAAIVDELRLLPQESWEQVVGAHVSTCADAVRKVCSHTLTLDGGRCQALTEFQWQRIQRGSDNGRSLLLRNGEFVLVEPLGSGGSGTVFSARMRSAGKPERMVAIKSLAIPSPNTVTASRVDREIALLRQDGKGDPRRRFVVHGIDDFSEGNQRYLVMEYCDGRTLKSIVAESVKRGKSISVRDVLRLIDPVLLGLQYLHDNRCVHRDIKPGNLIYSNRVNERYTVKIVDLGVAKCIDDPVTSSHVSVGTPYYMAPECLGDAASADERADLFGVAATIYCLLVGEPPAFCMCLGFNGVRARIDTVEWARGWPQWATVRLDQVRSDVPKPLADLVARTLAHDVNERPRNVTDFKIVFDQLLSDSNAARSIQKRLPIYRSNIQRAILGVAAELGTYASQPKRNAEVFSAEMRRRTSLEEAFLPPDVPNADTYNRSLESLVEQLRRGIDDVDRSIIASNNLESEFREQVRYFQRLLPDLLSLQHTLGRCLSGYV